MVQIKCTNKLSQRCHHVLPFALPHLCDLELAQERLERFDMIRITRVECGALTCIGCSYMAAALGVLYSEQIRSGV